MNRRAVLKTATASLALAARRLTGAVPKSAASPEALIGRVPKFPTGELGDSMRFWHEDHQYQFLNNLEMARMVYRQCPKLVAAPDYRMIPATMLEAYRKEIGHDPSDYGAWCGNELLEPDYQEQLLEEARDHLARRAADLHPVAADKPAPEPETRESLEKESQSIERIAQHVADWRARLEQKIAALNAA